MFRRRQPSARDFAELLIRHARMGGESKFGQRLFAKAEERVVVAFEHRLEGWALAHRRVLRGQFLHPVEGEMELNLQRLLAAERAIVVECGDPLGWRDEIRSTLLRHAPDEVEDRRFDRAVVPGGKRLKLVDNWRLLAKATRVKADRPARVCIRRAPVPPTLVV